MSTANGAAHKQLSAVEQFVNLGDAIFFLRGMSKVTRSYFARGFESTVALDSLMIENIGEVFLKNALKSTPRNGIVKKEQCKKIVNLTIKELKINLQAKLSKAAEQIDNFIKQTLDFKEQLALLNGCQEMLPMLDELKQLLPLPPKLPNKSSTVTFDILSRQFTQKIHSQPIVLNNGRTKNKNRPVRRKSKGSNGKLAMQGGQSNGEQGLKLVDTQRKFVINQIKKCQADADRQSKLSNLLAHVATAAQSRIDELVAKELSNRPDSGVTSNA